MSKDNNTFDNSTFERISRRLKKTTLFLEVLVWISFALNGVLAFCVLLKKKIYSLEITLTRPVLIQLCWFIPYAALIAFLMSVLKLHRKPEGTSIIRLLVYIGFAWLIVIASILAWPYLIALFQ